MENHGVDSGFAFNPQVDRRGATFGCREDVERLLRLARHLAPADRALLTAVYDRGMSANALAEATLAKRRVLHRRVKQLIRRVSSPAFRFVLRRSDDWTASRRRIGEAVVCHGRSIRSTARQLGLSVHHVRREIDRIRALCEDESRCNQTQPGAKA